MQRNQHRAGSRDLRCSTFTRYSHPDLQEATSKALCSGHTLNLTSTGLQADACSPSLHPTKQDQVGVSLCRLTLTSGWEAVPSAKTQPCERKCRYLLSKSRGGNTSKPEAGGRAYVTESTSGVFATESKATKSLLWVSGFT